MNDSALKKLRQVRNYFHSLQFFTLESFWEGRQVKHNRIKNEWFRIKKVNIMEKAKKKMAHIGNFSLCTDKNTFKWWCSNFSSTHKILNNW